MRSVVGATLTLVVGLMFVACSSGEVPGRPPPSKFTSRQTLPSCGETTAEGPNPALDELYPQRVLDCLTRSRTGNGAELSVTAFTTDGDPITTFYRTAGNSLAVTIFLDRSHDRYGGGEDWVQISCEVTTLTADALRECSADH